jgi:hypothetical protein
MQQVSKYSIGLRFGLITGVLYICLLFLRYHYFAGNPITFGSFGIASYMVILLMYLFTAIARKKELGGYADLKEIFQSIFIAILITELVYVLFNFVYLKYVDPGFLDIFNASSLAYYHKLNFTPEQIDMKMKGIKTLSEAVKPRGLLKGFGMIVVIDSIFGFIFAAIVRRKKPILVEPK